MSQTASSRSVARNHPRATASNEASCDRTERLPLGLLTQCCRPRLARILSVIHALLLLCRACTTRGSASITSRFLGPTGVARYRYLAPSCSRRPLYAAGEC